VVAGGNQMGVVEKEGRMLSPRERYYSDPAFHQLVDLMVTHIQSAHYTPSEMRDAALLASIKYEEVSVHPRVIPKEVLDWLNGEEENRG
jgi:hypothetical protein